MKKTPILVIIAALCISGFAHAENSTYVIQKGDTLYGLSKKFNTKIESIKSFNDISDPSKLYPGMEIKIPGGYTVKKGDTLYALAITFKTTVDDLLELNDLNDGTMLRVGQFLHVPAGVEPEITIVEGPVKKTDEDDSSENDIAVKEPVTPPIEGEPQYYWPHYGTRSALTGKLQGIQITGRPGDEIISVSGGTVVWASEYGIYKKLVLVECRNGIVYGYGGNERSSVSVGDSVRAGSVIGVLGGGDEKTGAYFFVYKDGKPLDPAKAPRV